MNWSFCFQLMHGMCQYTCYIIWRDIYLQLVFSADCMWHQQFQILQITDMCSEDLTWPPPWPLSQWLVLDQLIKFIVFCLWRIKIPWILLVQIKHGAMVQDNHKSLLGWWGWSLGGDVVVSVFGYVSFARLLVCFAILPFLIELVLFPFKKITSVNRLSLIQIRENSHPI